MPWKDSETAEEGAKEGECTACWVSEGTGHQGPEIRMEGGSASCLPLLSLRAPCTPLHIEGFTHHPLKEYLLKPHCVLVQLSLGIHRGLIPGLPQ